jgi:hypothetical protein
MAISGTKFSGIVDLGINEDGCSPLLERIGSKTPQGISFGSPSSGRGMRVGDIVGVGVCIA